MVRKILKWLGYRIVYVDHRGEFDRRYGVIDVHMMRPRHDGMGIAYTSAKRKIVKL